MTGTLFEGQDKLKLVTHCEPPGSTIPTQHEYVARERLAYRFLNTLTDVSFRVRPLHSTYVDDNGERATYPGFPIGHEDRPAARPGMTVSEDTRVDGSATDVDHRTLAEVFRYLIGNTDFSFHGSVDGAPCCHDAVQLVDADGVRYAVPCDFDRAGLLNRPGVRPARDLGIRRVSDRRFTGPCRGQADLAAVLDAFRSRRADMDHAPTDLEGLRPGKRRSAERFLAAFWSTLEDEGRIPRDFLEHCG